MQTNTFDPTTAIAVYGAVLATLGFALSLWLGITEIRRHRPRVRVTPSEGNLIDSGGQSSEHMIMIEALNVGAGPLTMTGVGWLLNDGHKSQFLRPYMIGFPVELAERKKLMFYFPCRWLRNLDEAHKIVGAFFQDEMGHTWKCRIKKKRLRTWMNVPTAGWLLEWDGQLRMYFRQDSPNAPRVPIPG